MESYNWFLLITGIVGVIVIVVAISKSKKAFDKNQSKFTIEYYPLSKKYYPKYKGMYLYQWNTTGIIEVQNYMMHAARFNTEQDARKFIELFKEQQFKVNVINISVNN